MPYQGGAVQGVAIVWKRDVGRYARYYEPIEHVDFNSHVEDGVTLDNEHIRRYRWLEHPMDFDEALAVAKELGDSLPGYRKWKIGHGRTSRKG